MSSQLDDLQDWITHPGTKLFWAHIEQEWGAGGKRFESSLDKFADSREEDAVVLRQIQQIAVCRREILKLAQWPMEEAQRLKKIEAESARQDVMRPPLSPSLIGMSRRGSL